MMGLKNVPALSVALAISLAMKMPTINAFVSFFALYALFRISKSVENGILNLFLGISCSALLSTLIGTLGFKFDRPYFVFATACLSTIAISWTNAKIHEPSISEKSWIQMITGLTILGSSVIFRSLTTLESTKLFAMLLPEDNAAWIHASSGFIRFNASAAEVTSLEYGSRSFLSNFLSFISIPTSFGSRTSSALQPLINVANCYAVLFLIIMYMSSITVHAIFQKQTNPKNTPKTFMVYGYSIVGIITVISLGPVFLSAGHLSLVCSIAVLWFVALLNLKQFTKFPSQNKSSEFWDLALAFPALFAIGSVWFPLIPVAQLMLCFSLWKFAKLTRTSKPMSNQLFTNKYFLMCALIAVITVTSSMKALRIPTGYSVSSLINVSSGGTMTSGSITLGLAIAGIVLASASLDPQNSNRFFLPTIPLTLLAYWLFSMFSNPLSPGYAVEKFSLLVAIMGIPLFAGFALKMVGDWNGDRNHQLLLPVLTCFAIANVTWGINQFPRTTLLDKNNWGVNYLPMLLRESEIDPESQLLCISPRSDFDMAAYSCSRFGSALQFKEFTNNNLARRWRSQLLGGNLDTANIPESDDFLVSEYVGSFLKNGGHLTVILTPGPLRDIKNRTDSGWMQQLPWDQITVVEQ